MMEMLIVLGTLLRKVRLDYAGATEPRPVMRITLQPDNAMEMRISRR
jgi:cytochrome P450